MRSNKLIQFYITNLCNSHCRTCGIWKNKGREELSVADIRQVVLAFPNADYVIGGGEAILHSGIQSILAVLRDYKVNYTLLSNCVCLRKLQVVVREFDVPAVTVSCDGINHDEIRGIKGNLDNIREFKKFCDQRNTKFKISYTYSKFNEDTFQMDMDMFKNVFGLEKIYFCLAQDMELLSTNRVKGEGFEATNFDQVLKCDMIEEKDKAFIRAMVNGVRRVCDSQSTVHTIYSNGDIVRCQSYMSREVLGNIKGHSSYSIQMMLKYVESKSCILDADCNLLCQRRYDYE